MTNPPAVVTRLSGGLGNQLFQYGAGRRLALANARPLILDLHWYRNVPEGSTPRRELLSAFSIVASFANSGSDAPTLEPPPRGRLAQWLSPWQVRREREPFRYAPQLMRPAGRRPIYLDGYWQSFRYLDPIRPALLAELRPLRPLAPHYAAVAERIAQTEAVMLHVRRGDYVHSASASTVHGALPLAYYERALQRVATMLHEPVVFVFSDDIAWVREHLPMAGPVVYVDSAPGEASVIDELQLMSRCRHQVIANSSLSWWAAWLNPATDKRVFAPARWLADRPLELDDLIPAAWELLDSAPTWPPAAAPAEPAA